MLGEDVQDQAGAVEDLELARGKGVDAGQVLEVAALGRCELVIEDDGVGVQGGGQLDDLAGLALADVGGGLGRVPDLDDPLHHVRPGGVGQEGQLLQGGLRLRQPGARVGEADQDRPFALVRHPAPTRVAARIRSSNAQRSFKARAMRSTPSARRSSSRVSENRT